MAPLLDTPNHPDARAQTSVGAARFTVVTPVCIRMEFSPRYGFVDESTIFAFDRSTRDGGATITNTADLTTIETGKWRLEYRPDGSSFHAENLKVSFMHNEQETEWNPESKTKRNLGGPVATLDNCSGPQELPDGLLSRDGWYLLDDSGQAVFKDGWIAQRPGGASKK